MVSALQRSGRHDEALQVLDQRLGPTEESDQQLRRLKVRMNSLLHLGRWEAIDETLRQRAELEQAGEPPLVQALLRDPSLREELAGILVRRGESRRQLLVGHQLRQLADDHPEHADALHRLMLSDGLRLPSSRYYKGVSVFEMREIEEALEFIEQLPRACDELAEDLYDSTLRLLDAGRCELAERVASTIAAHCEMRLHSARAETLSARIRWEHEVHGNLDGACVSPSAKLAAR